ncbi:amylo-alpha-1,6-glucosidase, partial [Vibrio parahaemolyticus]
MATVWSYRRELLSKVDNHTDTTVRQLVLASDAFVVQRHSTGGKSIIAGYHWFGDWGRD